MLCFSVLLDTLRADDGAYRSVPRTRLPETIRRHLVLHPVPTCPDPGAFFIFGLHCPHLTGRVRYLVLALCRPRRPRPLTSSPGQVQNVQQLHGRLQNKGKTMTDLVTFVPELFSTEREDKGAASKG